MMSASRISSLDEAIPLFKDLSEKSRDLPNEETRKEAVACCSPEALHTFSCDKLLAYLSLFKEYPFPDVRVCVDNILAMLSETGYPVDRYFNDYPTGWVINMEGCLALLKQIALEKKVSDLAFYYLSDVNIELFLTSSDMGRCGFLTNVLNHYIPIYMHKREDGKVRVVITDSTSSYIPSVLERLPKSLKEQGLIYIARASRQSDDVHCSTFSIRDLTKWMNPRFAQETCSSLDTLTEKEMDSARRFYWINRLPAAMMKSTQSLRLLDEYNATATSPVEIEKHVFNDRYKADKKINCYIEHFFIKYSSALLTSFIIPKLA